MHRMIKVVALVSALSTPALAFASGQTGTTGTTKAATASAAHKSATGVVKSMDATTLVISHPGKKPVEETFMLTGTTQTQGTVDVGTTVAIHYTMSGKERIATSIMSQPPKTKK